MALSFRRRLIVLVLLIWSSVFAAENDETVVAHSIPVQVSEGINLSAGAKAAVTKFFEQHGRFPSGNTEAGLVHPFAIQGKYVVAVTIAVTQGIVSAEFGGDSSPDIYGRTIEWIPTIVEGKIEWSCASKYIAKQYWPKACRKSDAWN